MNKEKYTVIAPIGNNPDALFIGIREFPTEKIILLVDESHEKVVEKIKKDLDKFKIQINVREIKGNVWEEIFRLVSEVKKVGGGKLLINIATGDSNMRCAATSAAFVNGIKAFSVENNETMLLPVLKFSYYKLLTEKKMQILRILYEDQECCASLEELSKKAKMSLPLISYHINGTLKSEGLEDLGLVDVVEEKGKMHIKLSTLGRLLIKGYVK